MASETTATALLDTVSVWILIMSRALFKNTLWTTAYDNLAILSSIVIQ